ncbi:MAG TPA: galactose mutarotase [Spirochaetales bacterium]|nr:galactose mutarotase [Spirochaetales bacterium]
MIKKEYYGITSQTNEVVDKYTLEMGEYSLSVITWGGTITSLIVPDKKGKKGEVTLGYATLKEYEANIPYFGTLVGRYANRIKEGKFSIDGVKYQVPLNDNGLNALHGGSVGFNSKVWSAESEEDEEKATLKLHLFSADGEMGFPGNLNVNVTYVLYKTGTLEIDYKATSDKTTPVNLTNHTYFNLAGKGTILDHTLQLECDGYLPVDDNLIVTGEILGVEGTPFDFREAKAIGRDIEVAGGYDHCFVLTDKDGGLKEFAYVKEPVSGRTMRLYTTMPGVQLYSGNFLNGNDVGRDGKPYHKHSGFCLETQHLPDAVNFPHFPNSLLKPGETYNHKTVIVFNE